ncbi:excalibur calcium-binding domain-containing protein [Exiguobacterium sp. s162]|uniref:excalibur calcium-binding domain-containing protein n=1 Tax=Exiguobacterium sp. s162 TaxID=2751276 RepID=UPI002036BCCB|nr:excalibur calcium-binding domain-containing protein [Exiguobacterium sp. s162]
MSKKNKKSDTGLLEFFLFLLILMSYIGPSLFHALFEEEKTGISSTSSSSSSIALFPERQPKPGDRNYYETCRELTEVYPNGVEVGANAYRDALDADKDGVACESY